MECYGRRTVGYLIIKRNRTTFSQRTWRLAIGREYLARTTWVFSFKTNPDGSRRYNTRLYVSGDRMERPHEDVYSPSAPYSPFLIYYHQGSICYLCSSTTKHCVHGCEASVSSLRNQNPISYSMPQSVHVTGQGDSSSIWMDMTRITA